MYLLDTNVCIQFLRNRHALVVQRIQARQTDELRLYSIVVAELYYGCLRRKNGVNSFFQPPANGFRSIEKMN